uniref:Uncharacterized protein n=1 Tax=Anopheles arabiensis TaxID=7173 RepID=A0A182IBC4_ANOAR
MVFISQLSRVLQFVESAAQISKMCNATHNLLNGINTELKQKLLNIEKHSAPSKEKKDNQKDFERFQSKMIDQWKTTLSKHVGQLIAQHVVNPVLQMGVKMATSFVSKELKDITRSMAESNRAKKVHRLKKEHEQKINRPDMKTETKRQLTDQYHGQLLKIMHKTRNPSLFATIIRENVPMDLTCVGACTPMIHKLLQAQNPAITGLTITVHGEKGIKQSFQSGKGGPEVHLELKDNHFTVSQEEETQVDTFNNNCLYGALATAIPELRALAPTTFRYMLKDERSAIYHLFSRFQHTFRFGGEVRKGVEVTRLPVDKIIKYGASNYKAFRKVKPFTGLQQAHVVRVSVDEELKTTNPDVYDSITTHAGHTQLTDKSVNVFHKIGGDIDRSQHRWLVNLATIDYTKRLNSRSRKIISDIKNDTLKLYEKNIAKLKTEHADESNHWQKRLKYDEDVKVLECAKNYILNTTIEEMYRYAKEGYANRIQDIRKKRRMDSPVREE